MGWRRRLHRISGDYPDCSRDGSGAATEWFRLDETHARTAGASVAIVRRGRGEQSAGTRAAIHRDILRAAQAGRRLLGGQAFAGIGSGRCSVRAVIGTSTDCIFSRACRASGQEVCICRVSARRSGSTGKGARRLPGIFPGSGHGSLARYRSGAAL